MKTRRWETAVLAMAGGAWMLLAAGCETLSGTTMDANQGAYYEAREFLVCGKTTREEIAAKYGKPLQVKPLEGGGESDHVN